MGERTPLRFLADEDADQDVADYLVSRGHDVAYSAIELGQQIPDRSVAAAAEQMGCICLTFNHKDFAPGPGGRGFYGVRLLTVQRHDNALPRVQLYIATLEFLFVEHWEHVPRIVVTIAPGHLKIMLSSPQ